jgi:DNA-binding transcriptional LysR family regulator
MCFILFIKWSDVIMLPNLDVDQLKTFLAIADTGSFTRAAEDVNKTQSAVSMQMKRLEEQLGRPLFAKDGRGVRFTADGDRLVEYARRIVAISDEAVSAFTRPDITGTIRFGTPDDYAEYFLPEILARFSRTHPLVTVDVECVSSLVLKERIANGELDLSIISTGGKTPTGEVIRREPLVWATSARHNTHLLETLPVAVASMGCAWRRLAEDGLAKMGRKFRVAYTSPNSAAINAAVLQGLAVGAMPEMCLRPGMRLLGEGDGFPSLGHFDIGLIRKSGRPVAAVEALARHVKEGLATARYAIAAE